MVLACSSLDLCLERAEKPPGLGDSSLTEWEPNLERDYPGNTSLGLLRAGGVLQHTKFSAVPRMSLLKLSSLTDRL